MWIAVTRRFRDFDNTIRSTDEDQDVQRKKLAITESLNRSYFGNNDSPDRGILVGSRLKDLALVGVSDADIYYIPPDSEFERFDQYAGNGQSAFLQDIKQRLSPTFPQTEIRGDGQVLVVNFNSMRFEVAPGKLRTDEKIIIPNTNDGGSWLISTPLQQLRSLEARDRVQNGYLRPFTRGIKQWAYNCNVPLSSFQIENLIRLFSQNYPYIKNGFFYFDWAYRDFFRYLCGLTEPFKFYAEFENEIISLGYGWRSRAETAFKRAEKACEHETLDQIIEAGLEWQKIFGTKINSIV